jgi:hypothetical protein
MVSAMPVGAAGAHRRCGRAGSAARSRGSSWGYPLVEGSEASGALSRGCRLRAWWPASTAAR